MHGKTRHEIQEITWTELARWIAGRRRRVRVSGRSMEPCLRVGEEVLVDPRAFQSAPPSPGDVIVVRHPTRPDRELIKRIATVDDEGRCVVVGDNPAESTDSRHFGPVARDGLVGRVTCRF